MAPNRATPPALQFVYDAEVNAVSLWPDFTHRIVDLTTYPDRLCDFVYGRFAQSLI